MKIKNFKDYFESISGIEIIGKIGPNYGEDKLPITLTKKNTEIICSDVDNKFYTYDDYENVYRDYIEKGGSPLFGFNKKNLDFIINYLNKAI